MATHTRTMSWIWPLASQAHGDDWEGLYTRELPRVYNFFRYRVGDSAVAEDLTSATFEKAWRGRTKYRRDLAKFSTWLFAIARNVAADHYRRPTLEVPLEDVADHRSTEDPEGTAIQQSEFQRLRALLTALPERERDLLSLKYGGGLTNREIARVTGLSESNIGTIVHRAIGTLREQW